MNKERELLQQVLEIWEFWGKASIYTSVMEDIKTYLDNEKSTTDRLPPSISDNNEDHAGYC
jgi:hypothetical protein